MVSISELYTDLMELINQRFHTKDEIGELLSDIQDDKYNYGYIDSNLECHLVKIDNISCGLFLTHILKNMRFGMSIFVESEDNLNGVPIKLDIYQNNNLLKTYESSLAWYSTNTYSTSINSIVIDVLGNVDLIARCGDVVSDTLTLTVNQSVKLIFKDMPSNVQIMSVANENEIEDYQNLIGNYNALGEYPSLILPLATYKGYSIRYGVFMSWTKTSYFYNLPNSNGEDIIIEHMSELPTSPQE